MAIRITTTQIVEALERNEKKQQPKAPNNIKEREAMFYIAVGQKGIGKTYTTLNLIDNYVKGNPKVGMKGRKVLIFDVNNEYTQYKEIASDANTIARFSVQKVVEARRISCMKGGKVKGMEDFKKDLNCILANFRGGLLVLEDLALIVGDAQSVDFIGSLSTNRHRDMDIITHFQSIAKFTNPKMYALKNILRLHKTADSCERPRPKANLQDDYDIVRIGEIIVNNRFATGVREMERLRSEGKQGGDEYKKYDNDYRRFHLTINFDTHKITGAFSRQEFEDACEQFLQSEKARDIEKLSKQKDRHGNLMYENYEKAFNKFFDELGLYYGNKK